MDFGIFTFGELTRNIDSGKSFSPHQRLTELIELAKIADQAGIGFLGLGEHHRHDFAISAPEIVLAAIARETKNLRLATAVTVLSTQDPVRLFEQFATLDLISDGRAEIIAGRGAFTESYPLFGYDMADYDALFEEKLQLLLAARDQENLTWRGNVHHSIHGMEVAPRPLQEKLPVWVGVGGTPASFERAGRLGLPLYVALLSGPQHFARLVEYYRESAVAHGHDAAQLPIGTGGHFFVAPTSQQARDTFYPYYRAYFEQNMPRKMGHFPRETFEAWAGPGGGLLAGGPQEVIDKIMEQYEIFGHDRYMAQVGLGGLPFEDTARSIELLATEVMPVVQKETHPAKQP
ncbi:LLM class flavin-dependent oxidoreductase [Arthrobacter crystallopoietes]|uniref:LLM class flavin-dependent oxidoreductase n=1 Tax=Crystallibacter crystallopoietes TaxID=37928 RepID=UPI001ABEE544|nr:LLM class flavin-dependent oxidoreductase [Arthrobacter crystallopoietes]QTG81134.1 LLM class flavin-dependent oxidoreductase [Arthrobacter crystallopoietes]